MLFYVDWLISTFTKEIWKLNGPCYMISIEFISFFPEETFLDADSKIFRTGELKGLPPLLNTETLRFGFMLRESQGEDGWGPQTAGAGGVFPASWKPVSQQNTEMVPGAGCSSIDLQLMSADLLPPDMALSLGFSSHGGFVPRWRKERKKQFWKVPLSPFCESSD